MAIVIKKSIKIVLILLCVVLLCVFAFSAYKIISTLNGYRVAQKNYDSLSEQFVTATTSTPKPETSDAEEEEELEVSPISVDFAALQAQSPEAVAWIYSPNTVINYPVAHTEDNFTYLTHLTTGEYNANGSIFIDCQNAGDFSDKNTLIYGHNMNDGSMFASLRNYRDASYYPEHPCLYISTPDKNYRLDLFAGLVTQPDSYVYARSFDEPEQFLAYVESAKAESTFESDVEVGIDDQIVVLSTCTYEFDDARYVVIGKLVEIQ
jgi:sortase B